MNMKSRKSVKKVKPPKSTKPVSVSSVVASESDYSWLAEQEGEVPDERIIEEGEHYADQLQNR